MRREELKNLTEDQLKSVKNKYSCDELKDAGFSQSQLTRAGIICDYGYDRKNTGFPDLAVTAEKASSFELSIKNNRDNYSNIQDLKSSEYNNKILYKNKITIQK